VLRLVTGVRGFASFGKVDVFPYRFDVPRGPEETRGQAEEAEYRAAVIRVPQSEGDCVINWASGEGGASMNLRMSHSVSFRQNRRVGLERAGGRTYRAGVRGDADWSYE
jgi:hypothetical protein